MREELLKRLDALESSCQTINCPINEASRDFAVNFFDELPDVGIVVGRPDGEHGDLWTDLDWTLHAEILIQTPQCPYATLVFFLKLPAKEFGPGKFCGAPECRLEFMVDGHCKFRFADSESGTEGTTDSPAMAADLMYCFLESRHKVRLVYKGFDAMNGASRRFEPRTEPVVSYQGVDLDESFKEQERKEQGHFADTVDYCRQAAEQQKEGENMLSPSVIGAVAGAAAGV